VITISASPQFDPCANTDHRTLMDRISEALLREFSDEHDIAAMPEHQRFERFAAYITVRRQYSQTFNPEDIATGEGDDTGIDAVAIIVNGTLVSDIDTLHDVADKAGDIDASFVFVQAHRSSNFDGAEIANFGFGVSDFFRPNPTLRRNRRIAEAAEIMAALYSMSSKFKRGNPSCWLYYVTTGKWVGDADLTARSASVVNDLTATQLFSRVEFVPVDAARLQELYRQTKNAIQRTFNFTEKIVLPEVEGVKQAYLGVLPASEFLKLLRSDDGEMIGGLFYDNVRDWQDYNPVNIEIFGTLTSAARQRFMLMNNGITIIARTLRPTGNRIVVEDYTIVNGCQTSHVLFENQQHLDDTVMVPIRLIETQEEGVINAIIRATNRQTQVTDEQFFALQEFSKILEEFFRAYPDPHKLYYERRDRQYDRTGIERTRIVTPRDLIKAFGAMFFEEPHRATRDYSVLKTKAIDGEMFARDHRAEPYYTAAFAAYKLEYLFRNGRLDSKYKVARFQILMAARIIANNAPLPRMNSRDMERYCSTILDVLWSQADLDLFARAATAVEEIAGGEFTRDYINTEPFTTEITQYLREE
jgi:hypothetical protein